MPVLPHVRLAAFALAGALTLHGAVAARLPAFPGAEGFGAYAQGGRGGDVYHVTNLNDKGAGSLAEGIAKAPATGRTIVFDVSGYIPIGKLRITSPKLTIAGQTAPGDGIGLQGGTLIISGSDFVARHLRVRFGEQKAGGDCINLDSNANNSILDHVSLQFGTDENMSSFKRPPDQLTLQWSFNAWGLETHSCGGLWDQNHATCHHTLWAHNHTRNPKARPSGLLEWLNNVTFDWDIGFIMGDSETPMDWKANVRGCYFICPPGNIRPKALEKANTASDHKPNFTLYMENNFYDGNGNTVLDGKDEGYEIASGNFNKAPTAIAAGESAPVTLDDPLTAYKKIVSHAGALRLGADKKPLRDEVDTILINDLVTLKRNHVKHQKETGASNDGFGALASLPVPPDSDQDGMPDYWETALGSNPKADDHNRVLTESGSAAKGPTFFPANTAPGYTLLEEYLHFLATPHLVMRKGAAVEIDLAKFTSGFAKAPVFTTSDVTGGAATVQPGGRTVKFVPAQNAAGRAGFNFTVKDGDGSTWTQQLGILIVP